MRRLRSDHQHRQISFMFDFLQRFHHLEAVHLRHLQVQQNQIVTVGSMHGAHRSRIHGRADIGVSGIAQHLREQGDVGFLVVDDQDAGV